MTAQHLEMLVEEPSMEQFLRQLMPRLLPRDRTFEVHPFQGKGDLLSKLEDRLSAYSRWLPEDWRVVVVLDRDDDDCRMLKQRLETIAERAQLLTRSRAVGGNWQLVNRIAVEELEAWYFGDWDAVRDVYPRVSANIPAKQPFRDSDAIRGGTWEAFERILKQHGYFETGLRKLEAARNLGPYVNPGRSRSQSFRAFCAAVQEAVA